jgi:hypothetical protein
MEGSDMKAKLTVVIEIEVSQPLSVAQQHHVHDQVCQAIYAEVHVPRQNMTLETEWSGEGAPE